MIGFQQHPAGKINEKQDLSSFAGFKAPPDVCSDAMIFRKATTKCVSLCEQRNWTKIWRLYLDTCNWCIHIAPITFINQSTVIGTVFFLILLEWKFRLTMPWWFWYWWLYSCRCNAIRRIGNNPFSWLPTKPYLQWSS